MVRSNNPSTPCGWLCVYRIEKTMQNFWMFALLYSDRSYGSFHLLSSLDEKEEPTWFKPLSFFVRVCVASGSLAQREAVHHTKTVVPATSKADGQQQQFPINRDLFDNRWGGITLETSKFFILFFFVPFRAPSPPICAIGSPPEWVVIGSRRKVYWVKEFLYIYRIHRVNL